MNVELISSLARSRRDEVQQFVKAERVLRSSRSARAPLRMQVARVVIALGDACYAVGGALIPRAN